MKIKKFFVSICVVVITFIFSISVSAAYNPDDPVYNGYSYTISNNEVTITKFPRYLGQHDYDDIPSTIEGYPVTKIGDEAFSYNPEPQDSKIVIPEGIISIGNKAFYWTNVSEIILPSTLKYIGNSAFALCYGSINLPEGLVSIGDGAFSESITLTELNIPKTLISIGRNAFYSCGNIQKITVDPLNPVYHSSGNCLIETESKTLLVACENSIIPSDGSVTSIAESAFSNCEDAESITIPNTITTIGRYQFNMPFCCLTDIYYDGTSKDWAKIDIHNENSALLDAKVHYLRNCETHTLENTTDKSCIVCGYKLTTTTIIEIDGISYYYKNGKVDFTYTGMFHSKFIKNGVVTEYLDQPEFKVVNTANGIKLSWNKVAAATGYKIYRSVYSGGTWSAYNVYKTTTDLAFTDTAVHSGTKVKYTVYAYNSTHTSSYRTATIITHLSQPTVTLSSTDSGVKVSWNKINGATSYEVYRSVAKNGKWQAYEPYKTTSALSFTDTVKSGTYVRYTVYAYGGYSYSALKTGVSTRYIAQPNFDTKNVTHGIKLTWNKVSGAAGYKIYRSIYSDGEWLEYDLLKTTTSLSYTDTYLKSGTKVKYTVYAYNGSYISKYQTAQIIMHLSQPDITLQNTANGVKVSWNKIAGAKSYKVLKSVYAGGKWGEYLLYKNTSSLSFTDPVKSGTWVKYTVYACNSYFESGYKTGAYIKSLAQPTFKVQNTASGVKISWNKVHGATDYRIYRSVYSNGKWSLYTPIKRTATLNCLDKVKSGTKVKYTVYACSGSYMSGYKTGVYTKYIK